MFILYSLLVGISWSWKYSVSDDFHLGFGFPLLCCRRSNFRTSEWTLWPTVWWNPGQYLKIMGHSLLQRCQPLRFQRNNYVFFTLDYAILVKIKCQIHKREEFKEFKPNTTRIHSHIPGTKAHTKKPVFNANIWFIFIPWFIGKYKKKPSFLQ